MPSVPRGDVEELVLSFLGPGDENCNPTNDVSPDWDEETLNLCIANLSDAFAARRRRRQQPERGGDHHAFGATLAKVDNLVEKLVADCAVRKSGAVRRAADSMLATDAEVVNPHARCSWKLLNVIASLSARPCDTLSSAFGEILPADAFVIDDSVFVHEEETAAGVGVVPSGDLSCREEGLASPSSPLSSSSPDERLSDWSESLGEESSFLDWNDHPQTDDGSDSGKVRILECRYVNALTVDFRRSHALLDKSKP